MNIIERLRQWRRERKRRDIVRRAEYLFQVKEHGGELWVTYGGCMVCPASMLLGNVVKSVEEMRRMYIENTIEDEL